MIQTVFLIYKFLFYFVAHTSVNTLKYTDNQRISLSQKSLPHSNFLTSSLLSLHYEKDICIHTRFIIHFVMHTRKA